MTTPPRIRCLDAARAADRPWRIGEVRVFAHLLHGDPLPEGARYADSEEPDCHHRFWSRIIELPGEERA